MDCRRDVRLELESSGSPSWSSIIPFRSFSLEEQVWSAQRDCPKSEVVGPALRFSLRGSELLETGLDTISRQRARSSPTSPPFLLQNDRNELTPGTSCGRSRATRRATSRASSSSPRSLLRSSAGKSNICCERSCADALSLILCGAVALDTHSPCCIRRTPLVPFLHRHRLLLAFVPPPPTVLALSLNLA